MRTEPDTTPEMNAENTHRGVDRTPSKAQIADYENPELDGKRSTGYEQRKKFAISYGRMLGKIPGGTLFLRLMQFNVRLLYPVFRLAGRLPNQYDRVNRWIAESEEMFQIYYAAARGETWNSSLSLVRGSLIRTTEDTKYLKL